MCKSNRTKPMRNLVLVSLVLSVLLGASMNRDQEIQKPFYERAKKRLLPPGAPHYGDVLFSSRYPHPVSSHDTLNTLVTARAFFANRLEWVYNWEKSWTDRVRKEGYDLGGTLNAMLPDVVGGHKREQGRIVDSLGRRIEAPWMVGWKTYWGCVNSNEYQEIFFNHAKALIDAGMHVIQIDDAKMNIAAARWGGCYCKYCVAAAKRLGKSPLQIQERSVIDFFVRMRKRIDSYAGRHVPISCNNPNGDWSSPYNLFDFGVAELSGASAAPAVLYGRIKNASKLNKSQVFTYVSEDASATRKIIALSYAAGGHLIVPWDVYLASTAKGVKRYYGKPVDFADLYGFIRANASLFNGYEQAAAYGSGIPADGAGQPLLVDGNARPVYVFARAQPGQARAPIVIHMVDWSSLPQKFRVSVDPRYLPKAKTFVCHLRVPLPYNARVFNSANSPSSISRLYKEIKLPLKNEYGRLVFDIPVLKPYGLLVISPVQ